MISILICLAFGVANGLYAATLGENKSAIFNVNVGWISGYICHAIASSYF